MSALDDFRPIAQNIARKHARSVPAHLMAADDLEQEIMLGAIEAAATHDPARGELLPRMIARGRGAMIDAARKLDPVTHPDRRMLRKVEDADYELTLALGRRPTEVETADALAMPLHLLKALLARASAYGHTHHLEERVARDDADALTLGDALTEGRDALDELMVEDGYGEDAQDALDERLCDIEVAILMHRSRRQIARWARDETPAARRAREARQAREAALTREALPI